MIKAMIIKDYHLDHPKMSDDDDEIDMTMSLNGQYDEGGKNNKSSRPSIDNEDNYQFDKNGIVIDDNKVEQGSHNSLKPSQSFNQQQDTTLKSFDFDQEKDNVQLLMEKMITWILPIALKDLVMLMFHSKIMDMNYPFYCIYLGQGQYCKKNFLFNVMDWLLQAVEVLWGMNMGLKQ